MRREAEAHLQPDQVAGVFDRGERERIEKPIAAPITSWRPISRKPSPDSSATRGTSSSVGATMIVTKTARPILMRRGTDGSPRIGAVDDQRGDAHERVDDGREPAEQLRVGELEHERRVARRVQPITCGMLSKSFWM